MGIVSVQQRDRALAAHCRKAAKKLKPGMLIYQAFAAVKEDVLYHELAIKELFWLFPIDCWDGGTRYDPSGWEQRVMALLFTAEVLDNG